jgi:hypothetical protein
LFHAEGLAVSDHGVAVVQERSSRLTAEVSSGKNRRRAACAQGEGRVQSYDLFTVGVSL